MQQLPFSSKRHLKYKSKEELLQLVQDLKKWVVEALPWMQAESAVYGRTIPTIRGWSYAPSPGLTQEWGGGQEALCALVQDCHTLTLPHCVAPTMLTQVRKPFSVCFKCYILYTFCTLV